MLRIKQGSLISICIRFWHFYIKRLRNQFDERDISIDLVYAIDGNRSSSFKNIRNWAAGFLGFLNSRRKWPCHFPEVILSSACLCLTTTTQKKGEKRNFGLAVFSVTEAEEKEGGVEPDPEYTQLAGNITYVITCVTTTRDVTSSNWSRDKPWKAIIPKKCNWYFIF